MTHDVFISYSSKDKPIADGICANIERSGVRCWIAPRDIAPGEDWPTAIAKAIPQSRVMVLVFSAHSNASEDVSRELFLAANSRLVIIPFKIEKIEPEPGKQYFLARTHWLDAINPPTQEQINALIDCVKALLPIREKPVAAKIKPDRFLQMDQSTGERESITPASQDHEYPPVRGQISPKLKTNQKSSEKIFIGFAALAVIAVLGFFGLRILSGPSKIPAEQDSLSSTGTAGLTAPSPASSNTPTTTMTNAATSTEMYTPTSMATSTLTNPIQVASLPATIGGGSSRIAFSAENNGNFDIYVAKIDGSNLIRLTDDKAWDWGPMWSPDGKKIAFVTMRDGNGDIYIMDADGNNEWRLTNYQTYEVSPTWSPDGKYIAYVSDRDELDPNGCEKSSEGCNFNIFVIRIDGLYETRVTDAPSPEQGPAWSPDGQYIAFYSLRNGNSDIYVMNADGSGLVRLTEDPLFEWEPAWSPDGKYITFLTYRDDHNDIYMMEADGSNIIRLTNDRSDNSAPAWSPDGQYLAFQSTSSEGNTKICIIGINGEYMGCLPTGNLTNFLEPAWQP